jgi:hypothetical protein
MATQCDVECANRQKDTFIRGFLDISGNTIITNGDVSVITDTLFMSYFFATQELDKEMQNTKQEIKALKQEMANVLIKLTEVANNCCNIDQELHP